MNNKGFTLIELLAIITILAIISLMTLPSLKSVMNNNDTRSCDYYKDSMKIAAKQFIEKEGKDIKEENGGVFPSSKRINLRSDLIDGEYLDAYSSDKTIINDDAYVLVSFDIHSNTYKYTVYMKCLKKTKDYSGKRNVIKTYDQNNQ